MKRFYVPFHLRPLLIAAGLLALVLTVLPAHAQEEAPTEGEETADPGAPTPEEVELDLDKRAFSATEIDLLQELEARRIELDRRAQALDLRERIVDLSEQRLKEKIKTLTQLETDLNKLLDKLSDKEEDELQQLAKIYSAMKPASAAAVLDKLDNAIVYDLFRRMGNKSTAKIMEKMNPAKARVVSEMLAEKSELPPLSEN